MGFCCCEVCRKWKGLASDNNLWSNLFRERWGGDHAMFYAPVGSKSWKDVYEVQDRCHRVGFKIKDINTTILALILGRTRMIMLVYVTRGLKIIREGGDYYLVHQGEIQRYLGSRRQRKGAISCTLDSQRDFNGEGSQEEGSCRGILDKILFFIGDLEVASTDAKRGRVL